MLSKSRLHAVKKTIAPSPDRVVPGREVSVRYAYCDLWNYIHFSTVQRMVIQDTAVCPRSFRWEKLRFPFDSVGAKQVNSFETVLGYQHFVSEKVASGINLVAAIDYEHA